MITLILTTLVAQGAPCDEMVSTAELLGAIEVAENAWTMADAKGFQTAAESMDSLLPCVSDTLTRGTAGRIHRMHGMSRFLARDPDGEKSAFAAARWVQPGWKWPADLVPVGHPLLKHYVEADLGEPDLEVTLPPIEGQSMFDGRESLKRPTKWPTIHQHLSDDGGVLGTWFLSPSDPLPDYPRKNKPAPIDDEGGDKAGLRTPLLIGAGSGFVVSGVLYALAGASSKNYHGDDQRTVDEMDQLRRATNTRFWASMGFAGASTATTVSAFAVARW